MTIAVEQKNRVCVAKEGGEAVFTVKLLPLKPGSDLPIYSSRNDMDLVALQLAENLAAHLNKAPMPHRIKVETTSGQANWMRDMDTGNIHIRFGQSAGRPFGVVIEFEDGEELPNGRAQMLCQSVKVKPEAKPSPNHGAGRKPLARRL